MPDLPALPDVVVDIEAAFDPVSVWTVLNRWSVAELADLVTGNYEAIDELATAAYQQHGPPEHVNISIPRADLEAYVAARKTRETVECGQKGESGG